MKLTDLEARIKSGAFELDIRALRSKLDEYEKAGQRSQSMSDGRGSGETPCPVAPDKLGVLGPTDPTDRQIRTDRLLAEAAVRNVSTAMQTLLGIQRKYLNARTTDAARQAALTKPPKGSGPCGNVWCNHVCAGVGHDRLRKSTRKGDDPSKAPVARCRNCDVYWSRNGRERDPRVASGQTR